MTELFSLGELFVSDFLKDGETPRGGKVEMKLLMDDNGLVRLEKAAPLETMYGKYWYRSGINDTMKRELKDIVDSIIKIHPLKENDLWIDIACNDGTLLSFVPKGLLRVGIDPVDDSYKEESQKHADLIIQDYFNALVFKAYKFGNVKAKVITSIAMFYDLADPDSFIRDIDEVMDDDGLWVMQLSYTPLMIDQMAFDNICFKANTHIMGANKNISELKSGDRVLDINGSYTDVVRTFKRKYSGKIHKIKGEYLDTIECTPEHPILIVKKENFSLKKTQWVPANKINVGDYLVVPKIKTKNINRVIDLSKFNKSDSPNYRRGLKKINLTDDFLWMMGLYLAEGHISGKPNNLQINFTLHSNEQNYYLRLKKVFSSIGYKCSYRNSKVSKAMSVQVSCTSLARIFTEWFNLGSRNLKIPDFIFTAKRDIVVPFLNGLIDGDGYISKDGAQVGLHSASKTLIYQTQLMLANLNAMTGFSYVKPYPREIRGGKVNSGDSWQIRGKNKFLDGIFSTGHKPKREMLRYEFDKKNIYIPIKKNNTESFDGNVYNIETSNNTYLVSNAVVHNCHEHIHYYSLFNIKALLGRNGFRIVDCQLNDVNGGSFRVYIKKAKSDPKLFASQPYRDVCNFRIDSLLEYEFSLGLDSKNTWMEFFNRIEELKNETVSFIKKEKAAGKTIWGYGASTKGNTLLQYFGLDNSLIDGIAERSVYKWGLKTVGTNIPIHSEDEMRKAKPDYLLVLPWHFINEFIRREDAFLKNGGKFIVPCPKFEIISY